MGAASRGRVFVISSPSGGGKTTVVARVRRTMPRVARSVSVTTRAPRRGERQGRDYHFVTPAAFQRLRRGGQLLEWARVHTAWYGTPKRPVLEAIARGRDIILSIDVQGARQVRRALGRRTVLVFLLPPSMDQLRHRLARRRTETAASMQQRLTSAARELRCATWYDVQIVNDRLEHTVTQVRQVMRAVGRLPAGSAGRVGHRNQRG